MKSVVQTVPRRDLLDKAKGEDDENARTTYFSSLPHITQRCKQGCMHVASARCLPSPATAAPHMLCIHAQVFYDAKDAAAFCLQAQQMLSMQQWPSPQPQPDLLTAGHVSTNEESTGPVMKVYDNPLSKLSMIKGASTPGVSKLASYARSSQMMPHQQNCEQGTTATG
eukprot:1153917-Pelagomonas_calceolata.AAC.3